jgi:hypothetical protein
METFSSGKALSFPSNFKPSFQDTPPQISDQARFLIDAAEAVANNLIPGLIEKVDELIPASLTYSSKKIELIDANLRAKIPAKRPPSIAQIINSAWNIQLRLYQSSEIISAAELSDLTLKSIEVFEYQTIGTKRGRK